MLEPSFGTQVPQVRYEVNYRCGKACGYCRPGGEGPAERPGEILSVADACRLIGVLADHGVSDIKLTGGDPALRRDIVELVAGIKAIPGIDSIHMVTRHERAGALAHELTSAGLDVLNFSIDSLDPMRWAWIVDDGARRGDARRITYRVEEHKRLIDAVRQASMAGANLKLNTVIMKDVNVGELDALIALAGEVGGTLKLLDLIDDLDAFDEGFGRRHYFDPAELLPELRARSIREDLDYQPGQIGHPMPRFVMPNGATVVVKTASSGAFYNTDDVCGGCPFYPCHDALMALRLTPDGKLQRCLLRSDNLVDLRRLIEAADPAALDDAIKATLHTFTGARYTTAVEPGASRRSVAQQEVPVLLRTKPLATDVNGQATIAVTQTGVLDRPRSAAPEVGV